MYTYQFYNHYNFKNIKLHNKYNLILDYVSHNRDKTFTKADLLLKSSYLPYSYYQTLVSKHTFGGYISTLFSKLNSCGIIIYNTKIRKWQIGPNFDFYYNN